MEETVKYYYTENIMGYGRFAVIITVGYLQKNNTTNIRLEVFITGFDTKGIFKFMVFKYPQSGQPHLEEEDVSEFFTREAMIILGQESARESIRSLQTQKYEETGDRDFIKDEIIFHEDSKYEMLTIKHSPGGEDIVAKIKDKTQNGELKSYLERILALPKLEITKRIE